MPAHEFPTGSARGGAAAHTIENRCPDQMNMPFAFWTRPAVQEILQLKFCNANEMIYDFRCFLWRFQENNDNIFRYLKIIIYNRLRFGLTARDILCAPIYNFGRDWFHGAIIPKISHRLTRDGSKCCLHIVCPISTRFGGPVCR